MVSIRPKMLVKAALENLGLHYRAVGLVEAEIEKEMSSTQWTDEKVHEPVGR